MSRSGRQICCRPILMESSPEIQSICHPLAIRLSLTTFAFRSREVKRILLDLDSYSGTDPFGMFSLFFEEDSCGSDPSSCCDISAAPSFG